MATEKMKAQLLADHEAKIAEINKVVTSGTAAEVEGKLAELKNIEKEYRALIEKETFSALPDTLDALKKHHFETISSRRVSEDGRMVGVEKAEKTVQIDLKKFCEFKGLDTGWWYELQALNLRLTMKVALSIGMKPADVKKINDSYHMDKLAAEIQLGKTPESNTQVIKHMQRVLDELCAGAGKVNNYDLGYVMAGYTKRSNKESLKVVCSKHTILQSLLTDVFHNVVTGKGYGVEYKRKGAEQQVEATAEKVVAETAAKASKTSGKWKGSKKDSAQKDDTMLVAKEEAA